MGACFLLTDVGLTLVFQNTQLGVADADAEIYIQIKRTDM
jgi:hypothetical protein